MRDRETKRKTNTVRSFEIDAKSSKSLQWIDHVWPTGLTKKLEGFCQQRTRNSAIAVKPWDAFRDITKKYCDLQTGVIGHWRSLEMSPFDTAHATSYWCSIVYGSTYSVVSEISNVKKCRDLEIRVRGCSRSLKVVPFNRLPIVSY